MKAIVLKNVSQQELKRLVNSHHGKRDSQGKTALMYAAECQNKEAVVLLAKQEQKVQDVTGKSAFMYACKANNTELMTILASEKNMFAPNGETPLMVAAAFNAVDAIKQLISSQIQRKTIQGNTALMVAAHMGNVQACQLLLKEAKMQNSMGMTAMMLAAFQNHSAIVKMLVQQEGRMTSSDGFTALQFAAQNNSIACIKDLLFECDINKTKDQATALMMAAEKNEIEIVKLLIDKQAGLKRADGFTAFMLAIGKNNVEIVNLLQEKEEEITNERQFTPLMASVNSKNIKLCNKFIKYAGKQDNQGVTALMYAADNGCLDIVKVLFPLEKGLKSKGNETSLHFAIRGKQQEVIDFLYNTEENVEMQQQFTNTMFAALNDCKYYIEKYGQQELKKTESQYGQTALMTAAAYCNIDLFDVLSEEIGMQDKNGNSALMIFVQSCKSLKPEQIKEGINKLEKEKPLLNNIKMDWRSAAISNDSIEAIQQITDDEIKYIAENDSSLLFKCTTVKANKCFEYLLPKLYQIKGRDGTDILMMCAAYNRADLIEIILKTQQTKQMINSKNESGFTALMFAAQSGAIESAKLLLKQLKQQNNKGITALMIAASMGKQEMIKLLSKEQKIISNEMQMCALWFAIRNQENTLEINGFIGLDLAIQDENCPKDVIKQLCKHLSKKQIQKVIEQCQDKEDMKQFLLSQQ